MRALDMSFEDAQDHEATLFGVLCSTADKTEGTSAFPGEASGEVPGKVKTPPARAAVPGAAAAFVS
jgi:hypothetical protein